MVGESSPPDAGGLAIETRNLRKVYGPTVAVEDLSLSVRHGEVFGFLGPNGAGKTTTVRLLLGLARPTAGEALVLGRRPEEWQARAAVGFLPEHFRFHQWLTGAEFLDVHGRLYGMLQPERRRRIAELLALVQLEDKADTRLGEFSKGMLQRIGLAQALLPRPQIVFLDEPTSGLDPLGRRLVRDITRSLRAEGTTVFLNSHLLGEVELTCDRVAIVNRGRVAFAGAPGALGAENLELDLRTSELSEGTLGALASLTGVLAVSGTPTGLSLRVADSEAVADLVAWLCRQGVRIYELTPRRQSLEDLFVRVVESDAG
jgi:ABC-2 type transport system ATP-binding protein